MDKTVATHKKALVQRAECHQKLFSYASAKADYKELLEKFAAGKTTSDDEGSDDDDDEAEKEAAKERIEWRSAIKRIEKLADKSHYEILEIEPTCTPADLKKAYRKMCLQWHPDRNNDTPEGKVKSTNMFQLINEAHETLKDPSKKRTYDHRRRFSRSYTS